MKIKQILIIIFVVLIAFYVGYNFKTGSFESIIPTQRTTEILQSEHHSPPSVVIEPGSGVETASFIIFHDDDIPKNYYAKNGNIGEIEFSGTEASQIIQSAIDALTNSRNWKEKVILKGNFTLTNTIKIPSYTILEIQGKLTLGTNLGDTTAMITNYDHTNGNSDIEIIGGEIDGNKASYNCGYGIYFNSALGSENKRISVRNMYIHDTYGQGLSFRYTDQSSINNLVIESSGISSIYHGLYVLRSDDLTLDNLIISSITDGYGVKINQVSRMTARNFIVFDNTIGVRIDDASDSDIEFISNNNSLSGATISNSNKLKIKATTISNGDSGLYFNNVTWSSVDCSCMNNAIGKSGLFLVNSSQIVIKGQFSDNQITPTQSYGIRSTDSSDYLTIVGCDVSGNIVTGINLVGSNNIVQDNIGYPNIYSEASYVVFTDGTNVYAQNGNTGSVDFLGTDASAVIQSALDTLTPGRTWQEKVILRGNFRINSKLSVNGYTILDLTEARLVLEDNVNDNMIEATGWFFSILSGVLDGNKAHQTSGSVIRIKEGSQRFFVGNGMRIINARDFGIHIEGISGNPVGVGSFIDIHIEDCGSHGILSAPWTADNIFSRINLGGNGGSGLTLSSSDSNLIEQCLAWNNVGHGIDIFSSNNNIVTGNRIDTNSQYGIRLAGGSTGNTVMGNKVFNNFLDQILPSNYNIIKFNDGYTNENTGTATVTNNDWIKHGLSNTPSIVVLTPRSQVDVWVADRNSTHFKVGVSTGTPTVDWYAEV